MIGEIQPDIDLQYLFVNQTQKVLQVRYMRKVTREDGTTERLGWGPWQHIRDNDPYAKAGTQYSLQRQEMTDAEGEKLASDLVAMVRKLAFCLRRSAGADSGPAEEAMNLLLRHGLLSGQEAESERRFREI